ncbi:MAG TPA: hypothetical protein VGN51_06905 [Acidimicrobiia bacterium]
MAMKLKVAALASCVAFSFCSVALSSGSAASAAAPPATDFSLSISPTRLVIGPDDAGTMQQMKVINGSSSPEHVTVQKRNFVGQADGTLKFQPTARYSASDWLTVAPSDFVLAPGTTQIVTVGIAVPAAPEPGDHQVALVFLVPAGETEANIKINRGIGSPVFVTVKGPVDDSTSLDHLAAPGFSSGGDVAITASMHNTGTVHRDFRGATPLRVTGPGTAAPFPDFTVMRGSSRDVTTTWKPPLFCICHPKVSFVDADGTVHTATVQVIVVPVKLVVIVVGGVILLALAVWLLRRRYHAHVTRAALALQAPVSGGDA